MSCDLLFCLNPLPWKCVLINVLFILAKQSLHKKIQNKHEIAVIDRPHYRCVNNIDVDIDLFHRLHWLLMVEVICIDHFDSKF